jgi:hypothetical protein
MQYRFYRGGKCRQNYLHPYYIGKNSKTYVHLNTVESKTFVLTLFNRFILPLGGLSSFFKIDEYGLFFTDKKCIALAHLILGFVRYSYFLKNPSKWNVDNFVAALNHSYSGPYGLIKPNDMIARFCSIVAGTCVNYRHFPSTDSLRTKTKQRTIIPIELISYLTKEDISFFKRRKIN